MDTTMSKHSVIIAITVIVVAVLGGIVYSAQSNDDNQNYQPNPTATTSDQPADDTITRTIDALHQYQPEDGRHIVAGTTTVPTPCHQLSTETEIRESDPQQVVLNFSASKQNADEMCAQVIQEARFRVAFSASEDSDIIGGQFDGDAVELNLRTVSSDQNLEDFQVYTKG
jgi:hypothetical protein